MRIVSYAGTTRLSCCKVMATICTPIWIGWWTFRYRTSVQYGLRTGKIWVCLWPEMRVCTILPWKDYSLESEYKRDKFFGARLIKEETMRKRDSVIEKLKNIFMIFWPIRVKAAATWCYRHSITCIRFLE